MLCLISTCVETITNFYLEFQAAGLLGTVTAGGLAVATALQTVVYARELELHPYKYPWSHGGPLDSLDHAGLVSGICLV